MGVSIGSRWVNKQYRDVIAVVVRDNGFAYNLVVNVTTPDGQYQGEIDSVDLNRWYYSEEEFTVDRILEKYGH